MLVDVPENPSETITEPLRGISGVSMSKERQKGTAFERHAADYLTARLGYEVDRMPLHGTKDRGDLSGVRLRGMRCVVECKDQKAYKWSEYFDEMLEERANDDAEIGFCLFHRKGVGPAKFGRNIVLMELDDLLSVAVGGAELLYGKPTQAQYSSLRRRAMESEHSVAEIARRANVGEGTVKNLLYKESDIGTESFYAVEEALRSWGE